MTLKEIIESRGNKYTPCSASDFQKGYETGWKWAYQDLKEILEQNGFDMNIEVMKTSRIPEFENGKSMKDCAGCKIRDFCKDFGDGGVHTCQEVYQIFLQRKENIQ